MPEPAKSNGGGSGIGKETLAASLNRPGKARMTPPSTATARAACDLIKRAAQELGFERCGIAAAGPIPRADFFRDWLRSGHAGTMDYLHRHADSRVDLRAWLPWAKSVIVVALNYHQKRQSAETPKRQNETSKRRNVETSKSQDHTRETNRLRVSPTSPPRPAIQEITRSPNHQIAKSASARIAMYAWGEDYHVVVREKLEILLDRVRSAIAAPFQARICVDTSAIIERELAAAAGIGWIGKNTLVLHQSLGSCFFLGEIVTDLDLPPDDPLPDHCGNCTRCLDACPTQAFPAAYAMDARRCISYLTIEHRGAIAPELAAKMGDWVFGCDVCQEVCPFNRDAPESAEPRFYPDAEGAAVDLIEVLAWDDATYRAAVKGKATNRAKLEMWKRNAEIVRRNLDSAGSDAPNTPSPPGITP